MNPQQTTAHAHSGTSLQHHNKESPCPTESYPLGISRHHFHNDKDKSPLMTNRATCRCGIVELKNTEAYAATKRIPWLFATNPQQEQAHALSESCLTHIPPTSPRQQAECPHRVEPRLSGTSTICFTTKHSPHPHLSGSFRERSFAVRIVYVIKHFGKQCFVFLHEASLNEL